MKTLLLLGFLFVAEASICRAQTQGFAVDLINPSRAYLLVDDAWQRNAECLQVKVSVTAEVSDPVFKAYFYGADGKLLETARTPSRQTNDEGNETRPQTRFEKGRKYEFYFGVPEAAKKWKRAIIVFGKPGDYATKIYPKDDLAKFDFPEKEPAVSVAAVPAAPKVIAPPTKKGALLGKLSPQVLTLKRGFDAQVEGEVAKAYDLAVKDLNQKYIFALERAQEKAQEAGKLEEAVAIKADKEAVAAGNGVPATNDETTPAVVKQLRSTYRQAIGPLDAERIKKLQPLQGTFLKSLDALVVSLTKEGKLDEALAVKNDRENLAAEFAEPPRMVALGQTMGEDKLVLTAKATIPSNNPDGYRFGPISKDDVITLKYLEGRWKNHGVIASYSPDDPATPDASRLVIAMPSKDGVPGDVIAVVPPSTALTPFDFKSPVASDQLVLRINANSNNTGNPGAAVYQLEVKRLSLSSAAAALSQRPAAATPTTAGTKGALLVNSLGMKFVSVPRTEVLMCIHETRRKDYAAFAATNPRTDEGWKKAVDRGVPVGKGDDDPVVMVNFDDATAFCAWLSKKEGKVYRLPTDREWSMAVGIGDRESPDATPLSLNEKIRDEFPWGKAWPPPKGSVNLRDSSCGKTFPAANGVSNVEDYTDGFVTTAPVMSFTPNSLGIYDLGGNVWEWCSDWFEKDKGTHVLRGGNYGSIRGGVLSSYRIGGSAARTPGRGFRCVVASQNAAAAPQKVDEGSIMECEDLVVSGKKFTEGTLKNKEVAFGNRGYVWWKVPQALSGSRYTKTDGGVPAEIKVRAKRDTMVRIFNQPSDPGVDLSGWEQTELQFTFNYAKWPEVVVYTRKLSAGKELEIPQGNWGGTRVLLPPATTTNSAGEKAPELSWLIGKTWSTDAGNTLEFSTGGTGERMTKSGKTPFTWRIMPSGLVEVVLKGSAPLTLYVEIKSASEGAFGNTEANRPTQIHVK